MTNNENRFATMPEILKEYETLEVAMADPAIHSDQGKARQLGKRYAQLGPIVAGYRDYLKAADDLKAALKNLWQLMQILQRKSRLFVRLLKNQELI
jgi:peptide chain release factor 1